MEYLETILSELQSLSMNALIQIILIFAVFYWISKKFQRPFFRIVIILISSFLIANVEKGSIIVNIAIIIGVAILIPHIGFLFSTIANIFTSIKNMTANTYFFFVSIVYKILRFFKWIIDILLVIKGFFFRAKKEENNSNSSYHDKQDYSNNKNEDSSNNDYSKKEDDYSSKNSYNSYRDNDSKKREQRYKEDFRSSSNEAKEETIYEEYDNLEHIADELKRFYSQSAYIILGVSENDDFTHIKKSYRALVSIYHPDRNLDEIELYTEITQNINSAYDKLKKIKGK